jgi:hypothetical protein
LTRLFIPVALGLLILGSPSGPAWAEGRTDLDLLKVPVLEIERDLPRFQRVAFLDVIPWVTLFRNQKEGQVSSIRLLELPLGTFFASDRSGEEVDVRVLELPFLGSVYRHHGDRERYRTEILFWLHIEGERKAGFSP